MTQPIQPASPFETYRDTMFLTAVAVYRADKAGEPTNDIPLQALPVNLGDLSVEGMRNANKALADVKAGARALARHAILADEIDAGGIAGFFARVERRASFVPIFGEKKYVGKELKPGGLVDAIRASRTA